MTLPRRLLELAQRLENSKEKRIRQAALRKAVSASYYAVFHLLTTEYAALFSADPVIQAAITRTVNHKDVDLAAKDFVAATPRLPKALDSKGLVVTPELAFVARTFIDLQVERNKADYDLSLTYSQGQVQGIVGVALDAFTNWEVARTTPTAKLFLACFQLKKTWDVER